MEKEYNIMLTSIGAPGKRDAHRYFYYTREGMRWYCDGMNVAEAGTKYILSQVPINEIIVLGSANSYNEGEQLDPIRLVDFIDFPAGSIDELSEYAFYRYRISEYLNNLDIEGADVLNSFSAEKQNELLKRCESMLAELSGRIENFRPDRIFHYIASDKEIYLLMKEAMSDLSAEEKLWLKRYMYSARLSDAFKLKPLVGSEEMQIMMIPTARTAEEYEPGENVRQIIDEIRSADAEQINVYMDMQGLEQTEGYMILAVLSILGQDENNPINIREIITSHDLERFANPIDNNEMKRYQINNLISGMNAFIRYGKVDEVSAYWQSRQIENTHIDHLLYAMKRVDEGITLCNIGDLEFGIRMLKDVFSNTPKEELPETETNIFSIIEHSIKADYGSILDGDTPDELELIKWALRKKLYQQALTIIEAKIPAAIVNRGMLYYAVDEESKNKALEAFNKSYWEDLPRERWKYDDLTHYFIRYYGRPQPRYGDYSRMSYGEYRLTSLDPKEDNPMMKSYSVLGDRKELLKRIITAYYDLGLVRNQINHAGSVRVNPEDVDITEENPNMVKMLGVINDFVVSYEKARQYIEENVPKDFPIVSITPEEMKEYTSSHKIETEGKGKGRFGGHSDHGDNGRKHDSQQNKPEARQEERQETRHYPDSEHKKNDTYASRDDGPVTVSRVKRVDGKPFRITITIDEGE